MSEFVKILVASFTVLLLMYVFLDVLPVSGLMSGNSFLNSQDRLMHTMLAEDKWASSSLWSITETEGTVSDGFPDKEKGLLLPFSTKTSWFERGVIELVVKRADGGELVMGINGKEIYRGSPNTGKRYVYFDKELLTGEDVLEIKASRGAAFWGSAEYDVKAAIKGEVYSAINTTFLAPDSYKKPKLIVAFGQTEGKLTIKLNGQTIFEGEPDQTMNMDLPKLKKANTIEFLADVAAKHYVTWAEVRFEK